MCTRLSIITNTRGRLDIFPDICRAIWKYAYDPHAIEHIVTYDYDDLETQNFLLEYIRSGPNIRAMAIIPRADYKNLHDEYWNVAAKISNGRVIFGLCNDTKIFTQNYDKFLVDAVDNFRAQNGHDIVQILVNDDSQNHVDKEAYPVNEFCAWVVLSKSAVDIIGGIVPGELISTNGDVFTYEIFKNLKYPAQIDLRNVIETQHISHYTGRREIDRVSVGVHINGNKLEPEEILYYQDKLNKGIEAQLNDKFLHRDRC